MESRHWYLQGPEEAEVEIIHDGHHIRAKTRGAGWNNRSFATPDEAGHAVDGWLAELLTTGWELVAEGSAADRRSIWSRVASVEGDWVTIQVGQNALEPGNPELIADAVVEAAPRVLQISNRTPAPDLSPILDAYLVYPPPSVEELVIDTRDQPMTRQAYYAWGEIGTLLSLMPALRRAYVAGDVWVDELASTTLESLRIVADPLLPESIEAIAAADCPVLTTLGLSVASESEASEGTLAAVDKLFSTSEKALPALRHLQLAGFEKPAALLERVADKPLTARLETLRITDCEVEDEDVALPALLRVADRYRHLEILGLGVDVLSEEGLATLEAALPCVRDDELLDDGFGVAAYDQREPEPEPDADDEADVD